MQKPHTSSLSSQSQIEAFYNDILMEYQIRLEKEQKNGKIPPNKSEDIIKRIKQIVKDHGYLLKNSYRSLKKQQQQQLTEREQRQLRETIQEQQKLQQTKLQVKKEQNSDEQDDFALFERQQANKKNQTKEIQPEIAIDKQEQVALKQQDGQLAENIIKQQGQKDQLMNKLRKHANLYLDICLQGIFISSKKKYIAKSEKTKLTLDNAFVKVKDKQYFYKSIQCELTTVRIDQVIEDFKLSL